MPCLLIFVTQLPDNNHAIVVSKMASTAAAEYTSSHNSIDLICSKLQAVDGSTGHKPSPDNAVSSNNNSIAAENGKTATPEGDFSKPPVEVVNRHHRRKNFAPKCVVVQRTTDDDDDDDGMQDGAWSRDDSVLDLRLPTGNDVVAEKPERAPSSEVPEVKDDGVLDLSKTGPRDVTTRPSLTAAAAAAGAGSVFQSAIRTFLLQQEQINNSGRPDTNTDDDDGGGGQRGRHLNLMSGGQTMLGETDYYFRSAAAVTSLPEMTSDNGRSVLTASGGLLSALKRESTRVDDIRNAYSRLKLHIPLLVIIVSLFLTKSNEM